KYINSFFVSDYVRKKFVKYGGYDIKGRKLNPPVSTGFNNTNKRDRNTTNICIIGRIHEDKGFADFISAWKQMKNKEFVNSVMVITPDDLSKFDTTGMTILHANTDAEMNAIYNDAHIFVSTGRNEGYGLPGLEAMATGCACILGDNGGVREYSLNGKNCIMYRPKDVSKLSERLDLLVKNKNLQAKLGLAGMETVKFFTEEVFVTRFIEYMKEDGLI
ncbi:MAG: glycosyltransferase family 4 protein, partial [Acholeplasmatales bacterium]|nr:glycosyltransferase family 4 protein [Acholeplasmatales bacterium]